MISTLAISSKDRQLWVYTNGLTILRKLKCTNKMLSLIRQSVCPLQGRSLVLSAKKMKCCKYGLNSVDIGAYLTLLYLNYSPTYRQLKAQQVKSGNTKGGSITVPLTSCLTGLDQSVLQIKTKIVSCHTADFQTSQTVGQSYSDTSEPFSIPWLSGR